MKAKKAKLVINPHSSGLSQDQNTYKYMHNDFKKWERKKFYQRINCINHGQIIF